MQECQFPRTRTWGRGRGGGGGAGGKDKKGTHLNAETHTHGRKVEYPGLQPQRSSSEITLHNSSMQ